MKKGLTKAILGIAGAAFALATGAGFGATATEAQATAPAKQDTAVTAEASSSAIKVEPVGGWGVPIGPGHSSTRNLYPNGGRPVQQRPAVKTASYAAKKVFGPDDAKVPNRPAAPAYQAPN